VKDLDLPSKYAATGTVASMLSNRVSWFFDFRGPSITVDTACSSSLVAAHEACMSLKLREIDMVSESTARGDLTICADHCRPLLVAAISCSPPR
jgi:hypothetical protein